MSSSQAFDNLLKRIGWQRYFVKYAQGYLGGNAIEILLTWGNDETCHVQSTWRYDVLLAALLVVAVGTVFVAGEYHRVVIGIISPAYDVEHWLGLAFFNGQRLVQTTEQLLVAILRFAVDEQGGAWILLNQRDALLIIQIQDGFQTARQAAPCHLQG